MCKRNGLKIEMCKRNGLKIEMCKPCEAAIDHQRFRLGQWQNRETGVLTDRLALISGEFRRSAGITLNFCPFTGDDIS